MVACSTGQGDQPKGRCVYVWRGVGGFCNNVYTSISGRRLNFLACVGGGVGGREEGWREEGGRREGGGGGSERGR